MNIAFLSITSMDKACHANSLLYAIMQVASDVHNVSWIGEIACIEAKRLWSLYKGNCKSTKCKNKIDEVNKEVLKRSHFDLLITDELWLISNLHLNIPCFAIKHNIANRCVMIIKKDGKFFLE